MLDSKRLEIRVLTREDMESVTSINSQHNKIMGITKKSYYDVAFTEKLELYFTDPDRYVLGAFFNDQLVSFVSVIRWKTFPYWTFTNAKAVPFFNSKVFQPKLNGLALLTSEVINKEATHQRHTYWYITSGKQNRGYKDHWRNFVPELSEFIFISRTIPKGHRPKNNYILNLMGNQTWEEDIILRIGVRKGHEEALKPYFSFLDINPEKFENEDNGRVFIC